MNYDSDDALDRALFALPLEEPPLDLRASILSATVYRPAPIFSLGELIGLGVVAAIVIWLVTLVVLGGGPLFVHSLDRIGSAIQPEIENYTTLAWIAAGGATAMWLTFFTGFQPGFADGRKVGKASNS